MIRRWMTGVLGGAVIRRWMTGVLVAAGLSGCAALGGVRVPAHSTVPAHSAAPAHSTAPPDAVARADRTHEVPTPARPERAAAGWAAPEQAVRAFAAAYINWTAATVSARLRALAERSIGQARATLELQSREVASDTELHRGQIANAGTVEAVGPLAGRHHRYAVVTRERTTAADDAAYRGLAPEWHVSVATVSRVGRRWVLSGWQPEG